MMLLHCMSFQAENMYPRYKLLAFHQGIPIRHMENDLDTWRMIYYSAISHQQRNIGFVIQGSLVPSSGGQWVNSRILLFLSPLIDKNHVGLLVDHLRRNWCSLVSYPGKLARWYLFCHSLTPVLYIDSNLLKKGTNHDFISVLLYFSDPSG